MNQEQCLQEIHRLTATIQEYKNKYSSIFDQLCAQAVRQEFSTGGEGMHRGYYCPSPIADIVIGNNNRGRLLKRPSSRSRISYVYFFNRENQIVAVEIPNRNAREVLLHEDEKELGFEFSQYGLKSVSECIYYAGRIQSYALGMINSYANTVIEYTCEEYQYSESGLETAACVILTKMPSREPICQHLEYHFRHQSDGYLSQYTVTEFDEDSAKRDSIWSNHSFDVCIKRKI